jgi:outer membrane protein assembly factor BamB
MRVGTTVFWIVCALCVGTWSPAAAQHSVTYQINPAHTGAVELRRKLRLPLREVWSRNLSHQVSYPIVARGKVFVTVGDNLQIAYGTVLYALDAETGATVWSKPIAGTYFFSGLAFERGRLFIINVDGLLRALDPDDGSEMWTTQLPFPSLFTAPPTAENGIIYLSSYQSGGALYAVNEDDGKLMWWKPIQINTRGTPTVSSDGVFISYPCGVYQFDAITGTPRWKNSGPCNGVVGELATAYYSDRAYARAVDVGNAKAMHVYDARTGDMIGSLQEGVLTPAFRDGVGYFVGAGNLTARSVVSNDLLWSFQKARRPALPPLVLNGQVIVASAAGQLFVLDAASGQVLQKLSLQTPIPLSDEGMTQVLAGIGVGGGTVFVPAGKQLIALRGAR